MSALVAAVVVALLSASAPVPAQQWSAEQQEVWAFIQSCSDHFVQNDMDAALACFHEDFIGWFAADPLPRGKSMEETVGRFRNANTTTHAIDLHPIAIRVYGDFAFVHYLVTAMQEEFGGPIGPTLTAWTDLLILENGRWYWIGDHGHPVASGR